jgi:SAM-dependent methyltransferase
MEFHNTYDDETRAAAYAELEFGGTYILAFRDLPRLMARHAPGRRALDFGCGTGRSSRFLRDQGYEVTGVDISAEMVKRARVMDPTGDYRVIVDGDFRSLERGNYDLILAAFPFDNIPGRDKKVELFSGLARLLSEEGCVVNLVSTPEIYTHEWVTFSTRAFAENHEARCGDIVRIVTTDYSDSRPVEDIIWPDADYRSVYAEADLEVLHHDRPLARGDEDVEWVSELQVAPWSRYVLGKAGKLS